MHCEEIDNLHFFASTALKWRQHEIIQRAILYKDRSVSSLSISAQLNLT